MSKDIDFKNLFNEDFTVDVGIEPKIATGNKLLANIFEITMLTNVRYYKVNNNIVSDNFGGGALGLLGRTVGMDSNYQSLYGILQIIIDKTVDSILVDQDKAAFKDPTERLESASIIAISSIGENVSVNIRLVPEKYGNIDPDSLFINIPL